MGSELCFEASTHQEPPFGGGGGEKGVGFSFRGQKRCTHLAKTLPQGEGGEITPLRLRR